MTEYVYRVVSEWDIGEEYVIFKTEAAAMTWLINNGNLQDILEPEDEEPTTIETLLDDGYIDIVKLKFISFGA
jgi:hypothetical protein